MSSNFTNNLQLDNPTFPKQGSRLYLGLICFVASLGGFLFGFDTAVISGTVSKIEILFGLSKLGIGWFTSSALLGCIVGAMISGALGDKFGRKPILLISAFLFFLSAIGSTVPPTFNILILARMIGGIGVGMASVLAPMYISEFAPPHSRGRLVALYQLSIVIGILIAYLSNWLLQSHADGSLEIYSNPGFLNQIFVTEVWRAMFGMEMIPAGLFFILLLFMPESPRWLIKAGKENKAVDILTKISGMSVAQKVSNEIKDTLLQEKGSIKELLKPGLRIALLVGIGLSFFGQLTGINVVIYYGPSILETAGIQLSSALQYQVTLGLINLIFTVIALMIIDRFGRRPMLIFGMAAVVVMLLLAGILFSFDKPPTLLIVFVLGADVAFLALSINAVIWVLTPEIFPNRVRGRAMSIATLSNWSMNTISAYLFPWYVATFGIHTGFYTFSAICFVATLFFWWFVPETKGKSLEEIEKMWKLK
jgi:MFS transporter, SP family, arabinose:H+ symporter